MHFNIACSAAHLDQAVPGFCTAQIRVQQHNEQVGAVLLRGDVQPPHPMRSWSSISLRMLVISMRRPARPHSVHTTHLPSHSFHLRLYKLAGARPVEALNASGAHHRVQHRRSRRCFCQSMPLALHLCRAAMHEPAQCTQRTHRVSRTWPPHVPSMAGRAIYTSRASEASTPVHPQATAAAEFSCATLHDDNPGPAQCTQHMPHLSHTDALVLSTLAACTRRASVPPASVAFGVDACAISVCSLLLPCHTLILCREHACAAM